MQTRSNKQRGIVILENMIALLVFSMGILGVVGLLAASIKESSGSKYRNDASLLANQVVGQMWASNKVNAALVGNFGTGGPQYNLWKTTVTNTLPGVAANAPTIAINGSNVATITVKWQSPGEAGAHQYVVVASINP